MIESNMKCISVKALKAALEGLSDDLLVTPNQVGNLAVFELKEDYDAKCIGYVDLYDEKYIEYKVGY